jgi:nucleoid DNA-binding protein
MAKTKTKSKAKKKTTSSNAKGTTKARTKSEVFSHLAEKTELSRKQISLIFDEMAGLIKKELTRGPGMFTVPGLMKITVQKKPATKARKGVNPFTGEEIMIKAKPARKVVKVRPLKQLKEMV